jgi:uncharacterized protein
MLLGIISDTHDQMYRTQLAMDLLRKAGAEALIHCGDLIEPQLLTLCTIRPFYFCFGNNDADVVPALRSFAGSLCATCLEWGDLVELGGKRIAVTHGHMGTDVRRLRSMKPDYFLSGHSHVPMDLREGTCRFINPGALHRAVEYTVALLNLETDELRLLRIPVS